MPSWMQSVGHVSINYWSIQGFFDIFQRQLPITDPVFLEKVGVLILFGLVLSTAAFRLFRKNVMSMA
jgi:ABC-2 type transport system permease protein